MVSSFRGSLFSSGFSAPEAESAQGVDEPRVDGFSGRVDDPGALRHVETLAHAHDEAVIDDQYSFFNHLARSDEDPRTGDGVRARTVRERRQGRKHRP